MSGVPVDSTMKSKLRFQKRVVMAIKKIMHPNYLPDGAIQNQWSFMNLTEWILLVRKGNVYLVDGIYVVDLEFIAVGLAG